MPAANTVAQTTEAEKMGALIASAGTHREESQSEKAGDVSEQQSATTSTEGNQASQSAPSDGQLAASQQAPVDSAKAGETAQAPETKVEDAEKSVETLKASWREELGLKQPEPETIETWKTRYSESSKEAHALKERTDAIDKMLTDAGIDVVHTRNGEGKLVVGFRANQKYAREFSDKDIPDVFSELSPKDQELAAEDPKKFAALVAKRALIADRTKRPYATVTADQVELTPEDQEAAFGGLVRETTTDGKPRYPDVTDKEVIAFMHEILENPKMAPLVRMMNQSREAYQLGISMVYNTAWRVMAPYRARKADAEKQRKAAEAQKKNTPQPGESRGATSQQIRGSSAMSQADAEGLRIAKSAGG
jgi:hypothetical protein